MDYVALRAELDTDPNAYGYAALAASGSTQALADLLNLVRQEITGFFRGLVPSHEFLTAIVLSEYLVLTDANRDYLHLLLTPELVDTGSATLRASVATVFGVGTTSRANLVAMASRAGSRAEQLGLGTVTSTDIATALRL